MARVTGGQVEEPTNDAELVERCRKQMQDVVDRIDWDAGDVSAVLDSAGSAQESRQVFEADMRELGGFDLELPERIMRRFPPWLRTTVLRHFVYRHKSGETYVVHFPRRLELKALGVVTLHAFIQQPSN